MNAIRTSRLNLVLITLACLALSVTFFAPHLWLMRTYKPGTFQWDRAHSFLLQCEQPLRHDIEPAMQWRLLPPLVAHALALPGNTPLVIPWLGIIVATGYVAVLFRRRLDDWRWIAGGTLLFATTSAVITPIGLLGLNDDWVWLGLLAVAFGRSPWATPVACLLCPWIDERFVIGFPLAWLVRRFDSTEGWSWRAMLSGLWLSPYAVVRLWLTRHNPAANAVTDHFLKDQLEGTLTYFPMVPLAWWMGLRAAWVAVAYAGWTARKDLRWLGALTLAVTLGITVVLAADLSRSIAIIMPVVFLGCFEYARRHPLLAPRLMLGLGLVNLLLPAMHISYIKMDPINPLPIEIIRLFRIA